MKISRYTGGVVDTNAYLIQKESGCVLVDAPQGVIEWLAKLGVKPAALWLTHSHFDHIMEAAEIQKRFECPVSSHPLARVLLKDPSILKLMGLDVEYPPLVPDVEVLHGELLKAEGVSARILHVPGHSPDSICFYCEAEGELFGGDVLMAGGIGRSDLPGGDGPLLLKGIQEKIYTLSETVKIHPGHGPSTTIGREKATNPFVRG